jgi:hypothetical protein
VTDYREFLARETPAGGRGRPQADGATALTTGVNMPDRNGYWWMQRRRGEQPRLVRVVIVGGEARVSEWDHSGYVLASEFTDARWQYVEPPDRLHAEQEVKPHG